MVIYFLTTCLEINADRTLSPVSDSRDFKGLLLAEPCKKGNSPDMIVHGDERDDGHWENNKNSGDTGRCRPAPLTFPHHATCLCINLMKSAWFIRLHHDKVSLFINASLLEYCNLSIFQLRASARFLLSGPVSLQLAGSVHPQAAGSFIDGVLQCVCRSWDWNMGRYDHKSTWNFHFKIKVQNAFQTVRWVSCFPNVIFSGYFKHCMNELSPGYLWAKFQADRHDTQIKVYNFIISILFVHAFGACTTVMPWQLKSSTTW